MVTFAFRLVVSAIVGLLTFHAACSSASPSKDGCCSSLHDFQFTDVPLSYRVSYDSFYHNYTIMSLTKVLVV